MSQKINFDTKVLLGVLGAQLARASTVIPLHQVPILRLGAACTSCSFSFFCENFYRRNGNAQIGKSSTAASRRTSCFCNPLELLTGTTFLDGFWGPAGALGTIGAIWVIWDGFHYFLLKINKKAGFPSFCALCSQTLPKAMESHWG